jgi:hypothetical protein
MNEPNSDRFRRLMMPNPIVTVLERREGGANLKAPIEPVEGVKQRATRTTLGHGGWLFASTGGGVP